MFVIFLFRHQLLIRLIPCYTHSVKKKRKQKPKKAELKVPTKWFNEMLKRAATSLSELEAQKGESQKHDENTSKRTRQRKVATTED